VLKSPTAIYINLAAYGELADHVELTEGIAMRLLDELLRLRALGVGLDYYLMDASRLAADGAYRARRKPYGHSRLTPYLRNACAALATAECSSAYRLSEGSLRPE
jgi:hypothetical protein